MFVYVYMPGIFFAYSYRVYFLLCFHGNLPHSRGTAWKRHYTLPFITCRTCTETRAAVRIARRWVTPKKQLIRATFQAKKSRIYISAFQSILNNWNLLSVTVQVYFQTLDPLFIWIPRLGAGNKFWEVWKNQDISSMAHGIWHTEIW